MAKQDRIGLRVDESVKAQLTQVAKAHGMSLSSFMVAAAREKAAHVQHRSREMVLSDRDRDAFLAMLDQPPRAMPDALRKAKKRQATRILSG